MLMRVIENECVSCGYPCAYEACRFYRVIRYYCDECGEEEDLYWFAAKQLCIECIRERLERVQDDD